MKQLRGKKDQILTKTRQIQKKKRKADAWIDSRVREKGDRRDLTISVLVEQAESLLELGDLIVCELICHFRCRNRSRWIDGKGKENEARERSLFLFFCLFLCFCAYMFRTIRVLYGTKRQLLLPTRTYDGFVLKLRKCPLIWLKRDSLSWMSVGGKWRFYPPFVF